MRPRRSCLRLAFALVALLLACAGRTVEAPRPASPGSNDEGSAPQRPAEAPPAPLVESAADLLAALGADAPPVADGVTPRLFVAELDGAGEPERVLVLREPQESAAGCCAEAAIDVLIVYRRTAGRWAEVARRDFDATQDGGTFDYEPGISDVRVERFAGQERDALVLRTESGQGTHDPRWLEVDETILRLEGDAIVTLECAIESSTASGPDREETWSARRTLTVEPGAVPLTVRVDEVALDHEVGTEVARATIYVLEAGGFVERGSTAMCACEVSPGTGPETER